MACLVADLHDLGVKQILRSDKPGFWLAADLPTTPRMIHAPQHLEKRRCIVLPPIREKHRHLPHTGDHLGNQCGGLRLSAWSKVDPQQKPAAHRQGRMDPLHLSWSQLGMCLIELDTWHVDLL